MNTTEPRPIKLKQIRGNAGLSAAELARRSGLNGSLILDFEKGWIIPRPSQAARIAKALNVSVPELMELC